MNGNCRKYLSGLLLLLFCGGCEMKGTVTDVDTGEPIEGAKVGLAFIRVFSPHALVHSVLAETNSQGEYHFNHIRPHASPFIRAENYLTQGAALHPAYSSPITHQLQSIVSLKGTWDVSFDTESDSNQSLQFNFEEDGLNVILDSEDIGVVPYSFDGTRVLVDGDIDRGIFYYSGTMRADIELEESGRRLTGTILHMEVVFSETSCESGCGGPITAVRPTD